MSWHRRHPLFASLLVLCALLALGEGVCIYERWATARALTAKLVQKRAELQQMAALSPAPTRDTAAAIEADLARARHALEAMRAELGGHGAAAERLRAAKPPATRADAYFDLATFVERLRDLGKKESVEIRPDAERGGFSLYANEGPDLEHIEPVFRQRLVVEHVLGALFESHPRALLAVKRETPLGKREREERDAALAAAGGAPATDAPLQVATDDAGDFFALDPRASVRAPGFLDATAFRVTFIGQTAALRAFLNRLAAFELPLLVREVQVEPTTFEEPTPTPPEETATSETTKSVPASVVLTAEEPVRKPPAKKSSRRLSTAAPIVARPFSKFTVTLECVELVAPADATAAAPAEKPPT